MYQINFPAVHPPVPSPPPPSLVVPPAAEPEHRSLLGILARMVLGRFMLGRVPSALPATQATCPYTPFHVPDNSYAASVNVLDSNSVLTADHRDASVVPTYAGNVAILANDQQIGEPIYPVPTLDARTPLRDFIAGIDDNIPATPASGTDATAASPANIITSAPASPAGTAYATPQEPPAVTPILPSKDAKTADSSPTKPVQCR